MIKSTLKGVIQFLFYILKNKFGRFKKVLYLCRNKIKNKQK